jgi:hypothetical protein
MFTITNAAPSPKKIVIESKISMTKPKPAAINESQTPLLGKTQSSSEDALSPAPS